MTFRPRRGQFRVLVQDGDSLYRFAQVDQLDEGQGVLLYFHHSGEKVSRHSDGRTWKREAGAGDVSRPEIRVPFSDIHHEIVHKVSIQADPPPRTKPFLGNSSNAFIFSSTVLPHNAAFAAELVDRSMVEQTLLGWSTRADYVSAQACSTHLVNKALILTVLHDRPGFQRST